MSKAKKILMIYTGGTIGMQRSKEDQTYIPFDFQLVEDRFPELTDFVGTLEIHSFDPLLDSSDVGPKTWIKISKHIADNYSEFDGFVVLHGTDTMAYTGSALSFMLEGLAKPVIITGAQLPVGEIRTDARENLITAIQIAAHPDTLIREVCIYFEYHLFRANRTKKIRTHSFEAFDAPNFRPIAEAGVNIKFYRPTPEDAYIGIPFHFQDKLDSNIGLLRFFPGMSDSILEANLLRPELKGVIIESLGAGNLPRKTSMLDIIRESVNSGKVVVNISQCPGGTVEMERYATGKTLSDAGVVSGRDLTTEAAVTKMMYLLGKFDDIEKVKHFMARNIRGEMTAERAYSTERYII